MGTKDQIYRGAFWLAVLIFVAATGVGIYQSIVVKGSPPALELQYQDYLNNLLDESETDDDSYQKALSEMRMAIDINMPERINMLGTMANMADIVGDRKVQIETLRQLADRKDLKQYNNLATALVDSWRETQETQLLHESIKHSTLAINVFGTDPEVDNTEFAKTHCNLGAALLYLGDLRGADNHFKKSLNIDPKNEQARSGLRFLQGQQSQ